MKFGKTKRRIRGSFECIESSAFVLADIFYIFPCKEENILQMHNIGKHNKYVTFLLVNTGEIYFIEVLVFYIKETLSPRR